MLHEDRRRIVVPLHALFPFAPLFWFSRLSRHRWPPMSGPVPGMGGAKPLNEGGAQVDKIDPFLPSGRNE